jgi:O-antigen/teichoic acid export membrane protein
VLAALKLGGESSLAMAVLMGTAAPMMLTGFGLAAILGTGAYPNWGFARTFGPLLALAGLIAVVVKGGDTALAVACVIAASSVLHFTTVAVTLRRRDLWGGFDRTAARDLISYGWRQLVTGVAWLLTYKLDQLYLSIAVTPTALGLYAVAATIGEVIVPVAASAGAIMLARVSSGGGREAGSSLPLAVGFCLAVACPLCLAAGLGAERLVSGVFGAEFLPAQDALRIYLGGAVALAVATVLGDTLRGLGHPLDPAKAEMAGAVATVVLLAILVPAYGIAGAAAASTASYILVVIMLVMLLRARLNKPPALG